MVVLGTLGLLGTAAVAAPARRIGGAGTGLGAAASYSTRGTVKSFGGKADRPYVNIAHDEIPGYMMAMTMSFEPRSPDQLKGLAPGDRVVFTFTSTDDGHRLLDRIAKQ